MKLYLVAVEPSADQLGADLITQLRILRRDFSFAGIGGPKMKAVGVPSQMDIDGLAILGITEALRRLPLVRNKIIVATERIETAQPDAVIFLDSYGFMVRLAERLRKRGFEKTLIKYVAPQVWAMRPSRADCRRIMSEMPFMIRTIDRVILKLSAINMTSVAAQYYLFSSVAANPK